MAGYLDLTNLDRSAIMKAASANYRKAVANHITFLSKDGTIDAAQKINLRSWALRRAWIDFRTTRMGEIARAEQAADPIRFEITRLERKIAFAEYAPSIRERDREIAAARAQLATLQVAA